MEILVFRSGPCRERIKPYPLTRNLLKVSQSSRLEIPRNFEFRSNACFDLALDETNLLSRRSESYLKRERERGKKKNVDLFRVSRPRPPPTIDVLFLERGRYYRVPRQSGISYNPTAPGQTFTAVPSRDIRGSLPNISLSLSRSVSIRNYRSNYR